MTTEDKASVVLIVAMLGLLVWLCYFYYDALELGLSMAWGRR